VGETQAVAPLPVSETFDVIDDEDVGRCLTASSRASVAIRVIISASSILALNAQINHGGASVALLTSSRI
jgi:hypothetical protein